MRIPEFPANENSILSAAKKVPVLLQAHKHRDFLFIGVGLQGTWIKSVGGHGLNQSGISEHVGIPVASLFAEHIHAYQTMIPTGFRCRKV